MNEALFNKRVTETLLQIEDAIEASGADIEFETVADILTLEFPNRSKIIINKQGAAKQLWVAAKSGGFHYNYDEAGERWTNDQTGTELFEELSRLASEQAGKAIELA